MESPKISIVTPSYNQGQYIEETIDSLLSQGYPNLELIIIDGGSTDNSVEIIKKYEKHLSFWISEKDDGQSDAINKGLRKCTGKVFNWLNSDDTLEPGTLEKIGKQFQKDDTTIVTGVTNIFNEKTGEKKLYEPQLNESLSKTIAYPCFHQPSTFILCDIAKKYGVSTLLHYAMDTELYTKYLLDIASLDGIVILNDVIANFRIHEASKTGTLHKLFISDIASIFYDIAKQFQLDELADKVKSIADNQLIEAYTFECPVLDKKLAQSIVEYYVYKYAIMYYGGEYQSMQKASKLIKNITFAQLGKRDDEIIRKIQARLPFLPLIAVLKKASIIKG